jgi:hypothetical protein
MSLDGAAGAPIDLAPGASRPAAVAYFSLRLAGHPHGLVFVGSGEKHFKMGSPPKIH